MDFPILLLYVSLVACMSVDRVLTHTDICACLIRVRGMTLAWPKAQVTHSRTRLRTARVDHGWRSHG